VAYDPIYVVNLTNYLIFYFKKHLKQIYYLSINNTLIVHFYVIYFLIFIRDVIFILHFVYARDYIICRLIFYIDLLWLSIISNFIYFYVFML